MSEYIMQPVKKVQFCAHDENETSLQFVTFRNLDNSLYKECWTVSDSRGMSIDFQNFHDAAINMAIITGVPFNDWTIL